MDFPCSCDSKQRCELEVNSAVFGDPCPGTEKYVEVTYTCQAAPPPPGSAANQRLPPWLLDLSATPVPETTTKTATAAPATATARRAEIDEIATTAAAVPAASGDSFDFIVQENEIVFDGNDIEVIKGLMDHCPPQTSRGLYWNWTRVGEEGIQVCPYGSSGFARWKCGQDGQWETPLPSLGDCQSSWLTQLEARMHSNGDIALISSELSIKTSEQRLHGGDIPIATNIVQGLAHRLRQDIYKLGSQEMKDIKVSKLLRDCLNVASNLLDNSQAAAWADLQGDRRASIATALIVGIEESALLLAETINNEKNIIEMTSNVLASVKILRSKNVQDQAFPYETEDLQLILPSESLIETSVNGAVRVASFLFDNLEKILPGAGSYFINSKILHTLVPAGQNERLVNPIYFVLRHLRSSNVRNPVCASWNYNLRTWSNKDCMVIKTNATHTMCQCHRISNFAVLMEDKPANAAHHHSSTPFGAETYTEKVQIISACIGAAVIVATLVLAAVFVAQKWRMVPCKRYSPGSDFYSSSSAASSAPTVSSVYSADDSPAKAPPAIYTTQLANHRLLFNSANLPHHHQPFNCHIYNEIIEPAAAASPSPSPPHQRPDSRLPLIEAIAARPQPATIMYPVAAEQWQDQRQPGDCDGRGREEQAITLHDGNQFVRLKIANPYEAVATAARGQTARQQFFKI